MRNDTIIDSTPLLHTINNSAKFQNDRSRTFREIARQFLKEEIINNKENSRPKIVPMWNPQANKENS